MKKKRSKLISMLLTLVMTLSLVPTMGVTASAAEWTTVNTYKELQDAVKAKKEYIKLGQDIDTTNFHSTGSGLEVEDWLTFENQTCTLDLNGKTLTLMTRLLPMGVFLRVYDGSNLTIKDSSSANTGAITGAFKNYIASDAGCCLFHVHGGSSLTLENGSFTVTSEPHESNADTVRAMDSNITIKEGVTISHPGKFYPEHSYKDLDGNSYALRTDGKCKVIIDGGVFDGHVKLSGYQDTNGSIQINKGTFKKDVQVLYTAEENNSNPAVTVNGGTFEGNAYLQYWPWKTSLYMPYRLNGGTFKGTVDLYADDGIYDKDKPTGNPNIVRGLDKCFGYSAVVTQDAVFTGPNAYTAVLSEKLTADHYEYYKMWLKGSESSPVRIIPNAWGMMESVTLNGKPIDYAKDWNGRAVVLKNNEDHTITFKWKDLADELKNVGYRHDAQCMRHTSGNTTLIPTDQIPTGTEYSFTIRKGADPNVYSFDLRLDLKKGNNPVNIFANAHIVKLMVTQAPAADTRTPIDSVTLNVPKLKEGATSGGNFALSGTNTGVSTINTAWENIPASGTVAGNFYVARITLTAESGYAFNTKTQVNLNGDYLSKGSGIDNGGAGMIIYVNVPVRHEHTYGEWKIAGNGNVHFRECSCGVQESKPHEWEYLEGKDKYKCTVCGYEIDGEKERIGYVYASPRSPIDGESPGDYTPEEWVEIGGANYKVESIVWKNMNDDDVTTFEAGKIYKGTVTFKADTGFAFDGDRIYASKIFNSSNAEVVGDYTLADGGTTLTATFKLKDENVVRPGLNVKVKLPTLSDRIGKSLPAAELVDTTLPENVKFMYNVYETDISTEVTDAHDYKVKPNQKYFYAVWLQPENITEDDLVTITKTYNVSYEVKDGGDAETYTDLVGYGVLAMYQTPAAPDTSKISSVALTVTAPKYGETPATEATGADGTFTVGTPTWSPEVTDGKFDAEAYTVSIPVTAVEDYSFDENCFYTINGYVATYADGKVSYTFPKLTVPHEHDYTGQPWQYLDPGSHYQACKDNDGGLNIQAHTFGTWEKVNDDTHKATCSQCKHEKTENHSWNFVKEDAPTLNAAGTRYYGCSANGCEATKTESIPKLTAISAVNVTVTAPIKDAAPEDATTAAGSPYSVANTAWEPTVSGNFEGGTKYTVKVSLEATGNNRFTNTTTFQINGQKAKIVGTIPATGLDNTIITLTFPATEGGSTSGGSSSGGGGGGVTKYAVAVSPADNGKVTPDKTSAAKGSVVTITAMANDGYALDTIKATDKAGKEIKLTDKGNGKYTFTMPASKVEVKAAFKQTASKPGKPAEEMKTVVVMQVGSKTMFVNGKAYEKDAAPVIMNDRTLVPIRFVTESLGGTVAWNAETKEVTLVIDGKEIKMTIGKTIEKYGVAPVIINGRTFVPVRFVADELGATTAWNAETKTVTITKAVTPVKTEK